MISIGQLLEELGEFPKEFRAYAYEGEDHGLVIIDENRKQAGFIEASEFHD